MNLAAIRDNSNLRAFTASVFFIMSCCIIFAQPTTTYTTVDVNGRKHYEKRTETEEGGYDISISAVPARFRNFHIPPKDARVIRSLAKRDSAYSFIYNGFTLDWNKVVGLNAKSSERITSFSYGFTMSGAYQPLPKVPLLFGVNMSASLYALGTKETSISVLLTELGQTVGRYSIPVFMQSEGHFFSVHFTTQLIAPIKFAQPYLMGMAGFQNVSSGIRLYNYNNKPNAVFEGDEGLIYRKGISSATTYSLALGGGLLINISEHYNLDLRAMYSGTGKIRYYSTQNISNWEFAFDGNEEALLQSRYSKNEISPSGTTLPNRSSLEMLMVSIGLNVLFR